MYQEIVLLGNLGGDPTLRYTPDGTTQERTVWFGVTVMGRQAEPCNQSLTKGQRVLVVGEMEEARTYTDREGNTRASLDVRARNVEFLTPRAEAQGLALGPELPGEEGGGEEMPF